VTSLVDDI